MDSDDTGYYPAAFFRAGNNFNEGDYLPDFGDEGDHANDDMDVTGAIPHNIMRRRSSLGVPHQPLANPTSPPPTMDNRDEEVDEASMEMSFIEEDSGQS